MLGKPISMLYLVIALVATLSHEGEAFVGVANPKYGRAVVDSRPATLNPLSRPSLLSAESLSQHRSRSTRLFGANQKVDGTGRGSYILGFTLLVCIWFFTIPTEFRRAHICTEICDETTVTCYDCMSSDEWVDGIVSYYKSGGGIVWDFSIDPKTKAFWEGTL
mmetsp:Transcript_9748/g.20174  ORF Transcript_9748/g.20174 Transcript_9748/m.20174 type:complete len:163 (-) Transcript_9748:156-644(-)